MKTQVKDYNKLKKDYNILISWFRLVPLFSSSGIFIILTGSFYDTKHDIMINGIYAILVGITILFVNFYICYVIIYKFPKSMYGFSKVKEVISMLLKSHFFIIWIITILLLNTLYFIEFRFWFIIYIILIIVCLIIQNDFIKDLKDVINIDNKID